MTTETVCVPRELMERLVPHETDRGWTVWHSASAYEAAKELRALLAQPVASEPVAWLISDPSEPELGMWFEEDPRPKSHCMRSEPLYRHPPAPAIPAGYALVPIEPTRGMYVAANKADDAALCAGSFYGASNEDIWHAMLAAAPQPAEGSTND